MRNKLAIFAAAIGVFISSAAIADDSSAVTGAAGGAVTGALVGGPVGAAVGGVVGLAVGATIDPPPERVVTYVRELPAPESRVIIEHEVVVGDPIPETVVFTAIPNEPTYAYAFVNGRRMLVDLQTNTVVHITE